PPHPLERSHGLRLAIGNGLQPDVWKTFHERFGVAQVVEFYGATESNAAMVNLVGRIGSVGLPFPGEKIALVQYDPESGEVARGAEGFCRYSAPGAPGELIARISEGGSAAGRFEGYTSREATEKKILRNVFEAGDAWFRTDDLLSPDTDGFYYFVDRVGDTFRWKGENVSTQEVAGAVMACPGIDLCAVYGVKVPGAEGRVGMAAVVLEPGTTLDGCRLYQVLENALPDYARPAFVRIQKAAELTGTFKLRKVELQQQGYDPGASEDQILFRDDPARTFCPLDAETLALIEVGVIRF
ncbi:MAG: AMP-binding protein, partial [Halioglobus sp.]|nr:AMP-binding protein [Halioglobus sp.]